jgi:hypothetical protein
MKITVTSEGMDLTGIRWLDMTPWTASPITTHVTVPGAKGLGKTFVHGADNAVTTLQGRVPWDATGQQRFDSLGGARVTVSNGIDTRMGIVTGVTVTGTGGGAWIRFSMNVTEV